MHFTHPIFLNHLEFLRAYRGPVTQEPEWFALRSDRAAFSLAFPFPTASIDRLSAEWDTVYLMPESTLLEKPLLESGYKHIRSFDYRSMPLRELDWAVQPQVEVRQVETESDMEDFSEVQARGFCETESEYLDWHPWMRAANFRNKNQTSQRFYVGYLEGRPVGVVLSNHFAGVTGIYAVATLPAMRKQGISTSIMARALSDAMFSGVETVVLQVVEGSYAASFYQKLGFETQFTVKILSRL